MTIRDFGGWGAGPVVVTLSCAVLSLAAVPSFALDPSRLLTQYAHRTWDREDGLPQNSVRAIAQTADGYLWVGTEQGLARFDGLRFVTFELRAADGRPDGFVNALFADGDALWVGTDRGLYRYENGELSEVLADGGGSVGEVRAILRDHSARLWIATMAGLFHLEGGRVRLFDGADGAGLTQVTSIAESADSRLCIADGRVHCLEEDTFVEVPQFAQAAGASCCQLIAFDSTGALWAGGVARGLLRFADGQVRRWDTAEGLPHSWVRALTVDREDNVWFGCGVAGVARLGRHGLEVLADRAGRSGGATFSLLEDREGNLWIGNNGGGLSRLSAPPFTPFSIAEGLTARSVRSVLEDRKGVVWIGTAGGGLHRLDDARITVFGTEEGLGNDVIALAEGSDGRLWVGTGGAGVFVRERGRFVPVPRTERASPVVLALHEDRAGRMWAGGIGGVQRLDGGRFGVVDELVGINATAILSRDGGDVWFANARGGAVHWNEGEVTHLGKGQGLPSETTVALFEDDRGGLWIGTHLEGLTYLADGDPFTFTTAHGLCDDSVFSIVEGPAGRLWMSSNLGVFAVEREQLEAVARGQMSRVECRLFGTADGMRSSECNGGQQPAAWRDRAGRLWFATVDGAVRVDPRTISDTATPPVVLEELIADGTIFPLQASDGRLELPPGRGQVSVRFTALTLTAPEQVRFRYRLEGLDDDWVEAGQRRVAYYTNLWPRQYRFHIQAKTPGSGWGEPGAVLDLRLRPGFFQTRWFLLLAVVALASLAVTVHRARVAGLRRREDRLKALVAVRTRELQEINSTLELRVEKGIEALRESDRMAAYGRLVAGVAHEVRHPIFSLRAAAHLLTQRLAGGDEALEELDIMERETARMNRLVDDLLELGRPRELELVSCSAEELIDEALVSVRSHPEAKLRFEKSVTRGIPPVLADRPAMIQVLVNLLDNACRHAVGAHQVTVGARLCEGGNTVLLTIADDGEGIPLPDQPRIFEPFFSATGGTGLGLAIALRVVLEHGGRLSVESAPGEGTVFTVELKRAS